MELVQAGIGIAEDQVGHVAAQGGRQLEAMAAGAGVHEHAVGDLADHRLPVRADVVQARPTAARLRIVQGGVAPGHGVDQRQLLLAVEGAVEVVGSTGGSAWVQPIR